MRRHMPGLSASHRRAGHVGKQIAFAVLIENGQYGGTYAAPAGAAVVAAAHSLGMIGAPEAAMSFFSEVEKTIERGFRKWTERAFGPGQSDELLLVHRAILEEIEGKIQAVAERQACTSVQLFARTVASSDAGRRALFQTAFGQDRRLEGDIRDSLKGAGCELPGRLHCRGGDNRGRRQGLRNRICHSRGAAGREEPDLRFRPAPPGPSIHSGPAGGGARQGHTAKAARSRSRASILAACRS